MKREVTWKSVADELPDDGVTVLIYGPGTDDVIPGFYECEDWFDYMGAPYAPKAVTHWAHMPEPPK